MKLTQKTVTLKNGKSLELRSASASDAKAFLDHLVIAHTESYRNLNSDGAFWEKMSLSEEEKILANFEESPNKLMMIALDNDQIVAGLGLFGMERDFTRHNAGLGISVQNAWANSGLGSAMMDYALESAKSMGLHRIDLTVRTYNDKAIALYEKKGFRRVGLLKDMARIDETYVDEYYYELILNK